MIYCRVIYTFRDHKNKVYGYRLQDESGQTVDVAPDTLKKAIRSNSVQTTNMKLTSDNRLITVKEVGLDTLKESVFKHQIEENYHLAMSKARDIIRRQGYSILYRLGDIKYDDDVPFKELFSTGYLHMMGVIKSHSLRYGKDNDLHDIRIDIRMTETNATYSVGLVKKSDSDKIDIIRTIQVKRPLDSDDSMVKISELTDDFTTFLLGVRKKCINS